MNSASSPTGTRVLRTGRSLLAQLWHGTVQAMAGVYFFSETWLLDTKHAQYGLAVTRIVDRLRGHRPAADELQCAPLHLR